VSIRQMEHGQFGQAKKRPAVLTNALTLTCQKRADYLATSNQMTMASTIPTKMMIAAVSCSQ
jgi:hypothetical protein